MQNDTDMSEFSEGERVIVDRGSISEEYCMIRFFFGGGYCEVCKDHGDSYPVHLFRLTKTNTADENQA
jgi:hypothetical protein